MQSKISEAIEILKAAGMPPAQQNERSALCLLALCDLRPENHWEDASNPLLGITPMMAWFSEHYQKDYAPNSRETVRRFTIHQFVEGGLALYNPDDPNRPVNSPNTVYQITPEFLQIVKAYGTGSWPLALEFFLKNRITLVQKYAQLRKMKMIPVKIKTSVIELSPGAHSQLIKAIIEEFAPRFAPGSYVAYVGDTGEKWGFFDKQLLSSLGIMVDVHGKMPDVALYSPDKNWLFLVEAATSHGPVDSKRHAELSSLFANCSAELIFISAFPNRKLMGRYLFELAWESEVWIADAPSHLIHFNGDKFLGPHSHK